jgi:transcription elongation factor GreA-like protein/transcription elongation GreA/GreB family factor
MPYLQEFKNRIHHNDFPRFLQLWEEYSNADTIDPNEFKTVLDMVKDSDFASKFGQYVETALPLWSTIEDKKDSYQVLKRLMDLQTTNTPLLQELAIKALQEKHGDDPQFETRLRFVGLKGMGNFQGALSNFDLLAHMSKGKFVYHTSGWGTGEIMDISLIREQLVIEFENVLGKRDLSFENAFKTLQPLPDDHFLARRFGDPDALEEEARKHPAEVVKLLLKDLGPKTASEIKDEMAELIIPEEDWTKWWQSARQKLKKDTIVEVPSNLQDPFILRKSEVSHEELFHKEIFQAKKAGDIILATYNFVRDFPNMLGKDDIKASIKEKLLELLKLPDLTTDQEVQILLFFEYFLNSSVEGKSLKKTIESLQNPSEVVENIHILAFKKRLLASIRKYRSDWVEIFLDGLLSIQQNQLRDYILKELSEPDTVRELERKLEDLLYHPAKHPEAFVWYFQKVVSTPGVPFSDKDGQCEFLEAFLVLLHKIETKAKYRDLVKKMYHIITNKRYQVTRQILEGSSLEFIHEFLLLVTKCQTFSSHDLKIMRALAEVVHPSIAADKPKAREEDEQYIWTTEEGYRKIREYTEKLGTVEIVENAREIEKARALGDLRENSEYKFALEKRSRLQGELKMLSEQLNRARIITEQDIPSEEIGVGTVADLINSQGNKVTYTILGPWDADPENNVLSFQSKLAQELKGLKEGDKFTFRHETYTVAGIHSFMK